MNTYFFTFACTDIYDGFVKAENEEEAKKKLEERIAEENVVDFKLLTFDLVNPNSENKGKLN